MSSRSALSATLLIGAFLAMSPIAVSQTEEQKRLVCEIQKVENQRLKSVSDLLSDIEINGKILSVDSLQRETVFLAGSNLIELKILEFLVDDWKERMIEEDGKQASDFAIDVSVVEAEIEKSRREFALQYPDSNFWDVVRAQTGVSKHRYLHQRRVTMVFDKVFMPGPADEWPAITLEAIKAAGNGTNFLRGLKKNTSGPEGKAPAIPAFMLGLLRKLLVTQLKQWSDIKFPSDGLPGDVVLEVNGRQWKTRDAFEQVKEGLFVQDMETAVSELICREALKQELVKAGAYLNDKDFVEQFAEYRKQFDNTLFKTEMIARTLLGYPTLEAFRTRWRLMKSYEHMIAEEIDEDALQAHAEQHKRFFGNGDVSVDVIAFRGRDLRSGTWRPDGMAKARKRAVATLAAITAGSETFDQALESKGEYYAKDTDRGHLGGKSLPELRRLLNESEYSDLLKGYSLAYYIFYGAVVGKVRGPVKGPDSWYLVRVNSRMGARKPVSVKEARMRTLVEQDYLTYRFLAWSKKILGRAKLK